jgi:hypothetical protein
VAEWDKSKLLCFCPRPKRKLREGGNHGATVPPTLGRATNTEGIFGEVAEWLNALVLKTRMSERASRVRIPPSPQQTNEPDPSGFGDFVCRMRRDEKGGDKKPGGTKTFCRAGVASRKISERSEHNFSGLVTESLPLRSENKISE